MKYYIDKIENDQQLFQTILQEQRLTKEMIEYSKNGKPHIKNDSMYLSKSHSQEYVVYVINDQPIGVDIEKIREVDLKIINFIANDLEKKYILENENLKNERFFEIWTKKEAYIKCYGQALKDIKTINTFEENYHIVKHCNYLITTYIANKKS